MTAKPPNLIPVVLESPFAGDVLLNIAYARRCVRDCLSLGESAYASHLFFTQDGLLDDTVPAERSLGIEAGFVWGDLGRYRVVYTDLGMSSGMKLGVERAQSIGQTIVYRQLPDWDARAMDLQFPVEGKISAKLAELNTLAIELELAKARHARLANLWSALEPKQRQILFDEIFEKGRAA